MISGAHVIVYSKNAEADRAFFRDVLGFTGSVAEYYDASSHDLRPSQHEAARS